MEMPGHADARPGIFRSETGGRGAGILAVGEGADRDVSPASRLRQAKEMRGKDTPVA